MNVPYTAKNVRLSFSQNLVEPKAIGGGKPRYSSNFIIDMATPEGKATKKELDAIIADIIAKEFPKVKPDAKDIFLRDGNTSVSAKTEEIYAGFEGNYYISGARAEKRKAPLVVNRRTKVVGPTDEQFPESGDYVNAKLNFFTVNGKNDKGGDATYGKKICCEIEVVQFVSKGESLGGGAPTTAGLEDLGDDEADNLDDI